MGNEARGWGRRVKVVARSDGDLMGDRKDGVTERQGQDRRASERGRSEEWSNGSNQG